MEPGFSPGTRFPLRMRWKLGDGTILLATFMCEILEVDEGQMRLLVRLGTLLSLQGSQAPDELDQDATRRAQALSGKYAYVPYEAGNGLPLSLRLSTLTGEHGYFMDEAALAAKRSRAARK